jgi:hypothetical protein
VDARVVRVSKEQSREQSREQLRRIHHVRYTYIQALMYMYLSYIDSGYR